MHTLINITGRRSFRLKVWKTLNAVVGVVTILNVSLVGALLPTTVAEAARNSQGATVDGGSTTTIAPGAPISVTFTVTTTGSFDEENDWDSTSYRFDNGSWNCVNVPNPDKTTAGQYTETFTITAPSASGTYDLGLRAHSNGNFCSTSSDSESNVLTLTDAIVVQSTLTVDSATVDGAASTNVGPGESVEVSLTVTTTGSGSNNDWQSTQYRIGNGSWACVNTDDFTSVGTFSDSFNINAPSTPGTYDLSLRAFSDDGSLLGCDDNGSNAFTLASSIIVQPFLTITNVTVDGGASTTVLPSESVTLGVDVTTQGSGSTNDWRSTRYRVEGGSWHCKNHSDHTSAGSFSESFDIDAPGANGTYDVDVRAYNNNSCNSDTFSDVFILNDAIVVATTPPAANPTLGQSCGLDIGLVVDTSGSMSPPDMTQLKAAMTTFANSFAGTPSVFSLTSFNTGSTLDNGFSLTPTQAATAIASLPIDGDGYTNWDSGLARSFDSFTPEPSSNPNLMVIATDGSPNRFGYPATDSSINYGTGLSHAVNRANAIKSAGTRIVVIGVGNGDDNDPDFPTTDWKLQAISGSHMSPPEAVSLDTDVIKTDFDQLGQAMAGFAQQLCPGSITVNKQIDSNFDNQYEGGNTEANQLGFSWTLDGGSQTAMGDTLPAQPGNHSVNETLAAGYEFVGWFFANQDREVSCSSNPQSFDGTNLPIELNIDPLSHAEITLCNRLVPVTTIGLDKQGPATVTAGNNLTYTLAWSVGGNTVATNAVITDPIPANTTFVSADNGGIFAGDTVTWNLGTKNPWDSGTVTLVVKSNSPLANSTVITNTGSFDTDQNDPVSDSVNTTASSLPVLGLTKEASPTTVNPLTNITYTVRWSVSGNANATNVIITDPVPTNVTFVSAADSGVYASGTNTITWNLGTKAPGASGQVTWVGQTASTAPAGQIVNTASVDSAETDPPITANATVNVTIPVVLGISTQPDLTITKTVNKASAKPGQVVTYTITVKNTGTEDATNVVVTDTLPKNLSFVNGTGRTKTWDVGTLKAGRSRVINVDVRVESDATKGEYVNTATVMADEVAQKQATATLTVVTPKVLGLATTGTGLIDYLFFASGLALAGLGVLGMRRRNRYVQLTLPW